MEYQYDKNDLITNPQKYQKTIFLGNNFLNTYKKSREEIIKKIVVKDEKIKINFNKNEDLKIILKKEKFYVEELLTTILNNKNNKKELNLENNEIIDKLLKKFEIKKRICNEVDDKFDEKDTEYNNLKNYLLLSKLSLIRYNETKNLKFLNTVLKINDTLCSQIEKLKNNSEKNLFKEIVKEELNIINNICNKNGVKFQ
jgi:hypothetical protein